MACKRNSIPSMKASQGQLLMVVISNLPSKNLAKQLTTHMRYPNKANVHNSKVIGRIEILCEHLCGLHISFVCNLLIGGCLTLYIYFKSLADSFTIIFYANAFLIDMQDYGHDRCPCSKTFAWHIYMMLIF